MPPFVVHEQMPVFNEKFSCKSEKIRFRNNQDLLQKVKCAIN